MHVPQHSTPAGFEGTSACAFLWLCALLAPAPWFPICQYQPWMGSMGFMENLQETMVFTIKYRCFPYLSSHLTNPMQATVTDGIGAMLLGAFDRS
jgi:hypothetical protein